MKYVDHGSALARAAAPALAAIEHDERRSPKQLRPLFVAIRELLFDPDLDLERIQDTAGFADAKVWTELREEVGQSAWGYLRDARLETAARLLSETPISVANIGYLVGYGSPSSFRGALRRFLGMSALSYRARTSRLLDQVGPPPVGADTAEYWQQVLAGELSDDEARTLDNFLEQLAPVPTSVANDQDQRWIRLRQTLAEGFVGALAGLPFADQRRLLRDAVYFPDTTLIELLEQQGCLASRQEPDRAVELALLGIDCLAANRMLDSHPEHAALGWARLARARWWAEDLAGAERDLERAARDCERLAEGRLAGAHLTMGEAESCRIAGAFHWFRGRRPQALALAERSVAAHRNCGSVALGKALLLRAELRAAIADLELAGDDPARTAELRAALTDVEAARGQLANASVVLQEAQIGLWIRHLAAIGVGPEIERALPRVERAVASTSGNLIAQAQWLSGYTSRQPEPVWCQAREGFTRLGAELWAARVGLDLARLWLAQGRIGEATSMTADVVSTLGLRAASRQDLAALKKVGQAVRAGAELTSADLDCAEGVWNRLDWGERVSLALELAT